MEYLLICVVFSKEGRYAGKSFSGLGGQAVYK